MSFDALPKRTPVTCKRCCRTFKPMRTGKIRAHMCPHDLICRPPKKTRTRGEHCPLCFEARQLLLFGMFEQSSKP